MAIAEMVATEHELGARTIFAHVPIKDTFVEPAYGRPQDGPLIRKLAREWDERAIGVVMLSLRPDGRYAIIDGQHRIEVARRMGAIEIPARVHIDLSIEEEARLYRLYAVRKQQSTIDRFRAGVVERDPALLRVKAIVESLGMDVRPTGGVQSGSGCVGAVGALTRVYGRYGPGMLELVLRTLYAAFGDRSNAYSLQMINGMAAFIVRFEDKCDWVRLVTRLRDEGLLEITQRFNAARRAWGGETENAIGQIIMDIYNKGLQHRLGPWVNLRGSGNSRQLAQRPSIVPPSVRISQRKALADVPGYTGIS